MFDKTKLRKAKRPVTDEEKEQMRKLSKEGYSLRSISEAFNRSTSVVHKALRG